MSDSFISFVCLATSPPATAIVAAIAITAKPVYLRVACNKPLLHAAVATGAAVSVVTIQRQVDQAQPMQDLTDRARQQPRQEEGGRIGELSAPGARHADQAESSRACSCSAHSPVALCPPPLAP